MLYVIEIVLLAVSLSMDAFSLSIALSSSSIIKNYSYKYIISVGTFHFVMPLIGYLLKNYINKVVYIPSNELFTLVIIILIIGIILDKEKNIGNKLFNPIIFAFTVSVDSLIIGLSLDNIIVISAFIFAIVSMIFTFTGFVIGKNISKHYSKKSKFISIFILIILLILRLI